jgi:hypothetical protein
MKMKDTAVSFLAIGTLVVGIWALGTGLMLPLPSYMLDGQVVLCRDEHPMYGPWLALVGSTLLAISNYIGEVMGDRTV